MWWKNIKSVAMVSLAMGILFISSTAGAQTGDARRIEGQTGTDQEQGFRITLPAGWEFDAIDPNSRPTSFSFERRSDPRGWGYILTTKRLHDETARDELEDWIAESWERTYEGVPYEIGPIIDTWLGEEEAVSRVVSFRDIEGRRLRKTIGIFSVKGQNIYHLSISSPWGQFDALQADIEFIKKNVGKFGDGPKGASP